MAFRTLGLVGSINQSFELLVALLADVLKNGHQCDSSYIVGNRVVFPSKKIVMLTPDTNAVEGFQPADFRPRRGLGGGHRQTLANPFFPRFLRLPGHEEQLFEVEDGARVLCHCHWQRDRQSVLTILIVHGLEGSSESSYVRGTTHKAFSAGMNVVRMNVRNCGGTEHLAPSLYHSGLSADIDAVTRALISEHKLRRLALIGFSMGGNQVLKLAGEWGTDGPTELCAVVAVSPAIDLGPSADALHLPANRVYEWHFLWLLKRRLRRKARLFADAYDLDCLRGVRTLRQFDNQVTARYCNFADADDYYRRASAFPVLDRIAAPTLVIHAKDDPFIRILPETRAKLLANPKIRLIETEHGGHCGFLAAADGYDGRWAERTAVEFLTRF